MAGYQVEQVVEVTYMEGRDEASLKPVKGWLGVGHIDGEGSRREIFGEVMYGDKDYRAFTMRCYQIDEHLRLDLMAEQGLVLDAGTSRNRVEVPADQIQKALGTLRKPVAALQPGDTVTVLRNPEHPAWKDRVEGEYGTSYVLRDDFEPLIDHNVQIIDRREDPGTSTGWRDREAKTTVRGANGFWYGADGEQDGSGATTIVSEQALDGSALPVEVPGHESSKTTAPALTSVVKNWAEIQNHSAVEQITLALHTGGEVSEKTWTRAEMEPSHWDRIAFIAETTPRELRERPGQGFSWVKSAVIDGQAVDFEPPSHLAVTVSQTRRTQMFADLAEAGGLIPEPGLVAEQQAAQAAQHVPDSPDASRDLFDQSVATLDERIEVLSEAVGQWNPHNPKMQPRIKEASRILDLAENDRDHFSYLGDRLPQLDLGATEERRRRDDYRGRLDEASEQLGQGMTRVGVPVPKPKVEPSAAHLAFIQRVKNSPSQFAEGADREARNDTFEGAGW